MALTACLAIALLLNILSAWAFSARDQLTVVEEGDLRVTAAYADTPEGRAWVDVLAPDAASVAEQLHWPTAARLPQGPPPTIRLRRTFTDRIGIDYPGWARGGVLADSGPATTVLAARAGWPFRTLTGYATSDGRTRTTAWMLDTGIHRSAAGDTVELPLRPLPLGMAANTLIYALPIGLTIATLRAARTRRRAARGRCTACAYDLANLTTCPECGHQAPSQRPTGRSPVRAHRAG